METQLQLVTKYVPNSYTMLMCCKPTLYYVLTCISSICPACVLYLFLYCMSGACIYCTIYTFLHSVHFLRLFLCNNVRYFCSVYAVRTYFCMVVYALCTYL